MSKHPVEEWQDQAETQADTNVSQHESWLWWQEYRAAYAKAAGLYDDLPAVPDTELQSYLRDLDEKILKLRAEYRTKLLEQGE